MTGYNSPLDFRDKVTWTKCFEAFSFEEGKVSRMKKRNLFTTLFLALFMMVSTIPVHAEETTVHNVSFHATITDAGQYVERMTVDYGSDVILGDVEKDTFSVKAQSTIAVGDNAGGKYEYIKLDMEIVKVETDGGKLTLYFNQTNVPTLT